MLRDAGKKVSETNKKLAHHPIGPTIRGAPAPSRSVGEARLEAQGLDLEKEKPSVSEKTQRRTSSSGSR